MGPLRVPRFSDAERAGLSRSSTPATNKPIYDIATFTSPTYRKFTIDNLRSRWQGQFGERASDSEFGSRVLCEAAPRAWLSLGAKIPDWTRDP